MEQGERKVQLIGNRFSALIAVCMFGYLAIRDFRAVFSDATPKSSWLINLDFLRQPFWAVAAIHLALYGYAFWVGVWLYRRVQQGERIVVFGFIASGLLGILSPIRAQISPYAVAAIRSLQGAGMLAAFFGALIIFVKSPAFGKSDSISIGRLLLFSGGFIAILVLLGALIYFAPWR